MTRKSSVIALDTAARLHPVAMEMGSRNTASENMAPMAMQPISAPTPTMTQRYDVFMTARRMTGRETDSGC